MVGVTKYLQTVFYKDDQQQHSISIPEGLFQYDLSTPHEEMGLISF